MVALEAMAEGKPVVATSVGGLPELLQDADAMLVEPDNPSILADGIAGMLDKIQREPDYGCRNRGLAARFSLTRMIDEYCDIYRNSFGKQVATP